jgi:hypothetical protein
MKQIAVSLLFLFYTSLYSFCFGQIKPMGFTQTVTTPPSDRFFHVYRPKLKLLDDTLYVCSNTGIYRKNLQQNTGWEPYAFNDIAVIEFVKNGDNLLAISSGTKSGQDSLVFISNDNGRTFENCTPQYLFEQVPYNYPHRIVQNPQNPNSILLFHSCSGLSGSVDFGKNWRNLNEGVGMQNWFAGFHPLDTASIFYTGETGYFAGYMNRSEDNGLTWPFYGDFPGYTYIHPGGDNCIHHIAFHPDDSNILVYSGEVTIAKSTDKGINWEVKNLYDSGMYFYKILFDEENPSHLYASGVCREYRDRNDTVFVYRSTDTGESWSLAYKEALDSDCGGVIDMLKYRDRLIFYTYNSGLFELDVNTTPALSNRTFAITPDLVAYPDPVLNTLRFETVEVVHSIDIIDISGRIVQRTRISGKERMIDVSNINTGIYFAVFYTDGRKITKKIVL